MTAAEAGGATGATTGGVVGVEGAAATGSGVGVGAAAGATGSGAGGADDDVAVDAEVLPPSAESSLAMRSATSSASSEGLDIGWIIRLPRLAGR